MMQLSPLISEYLQNSTICSNSLNHSSFSLTNHMFSSISFVPLDKRRERVFHSEIASFYLTKIKVTEKAFRDS